MGKRPSQTKNITAYKKLIILFARFEWFVLKPEIFNQNPKEFKNKILNLKQLNKVSFINNLVKLDLKQLIKSRSIPPLGVRWLITFA
jgi:hypothetical protein